jgi:hypothetical protein
MAYGNGQPKHWYDIKYAESDDGLSWTREGRVCIDYRDQQEYEISRLCGLRDGDRYRMWFAARGAAHRLGYAESDDGIMWTRRDPEAVLAGRAAAWDSEMQEYPAVFDTGGRRHMFHNGNGDGRTGIGHAMLDNV